MKTTSYEFTIKTVPDETREELDKRVEQIVNLPEPPAEVAELAGRVAAAREPEARRLLAQEILREIVSNDRPGPVSAADDYRALLWMVLDADREGRGLGRRTSRRRYWRSSFRGHGVAVRVFQKDSEKVKSLN